MMARSPKTQACLLGRRNAMAFQPVRPASKLLSSLKTLRNTKNLQDLAEEAKLLSELAAVLRARLCLKSMILEANQRAIRRSFGLYHVFGGHLGIPKRTRLALRDSCTYVTVLWLFWLAS